MKTKWDKLYIGLSFGMIGPWMGFVIFWLVTSSHMPLYNFGKFIINTPDTLSGMISVSLVTNLIFFFGALRLEWYRAVRGVIMASFIYAPFIVYFKYVA